LPQKASFSIDAIVNYLYILKKLHFGKKYMYVLKRQDEAAVSATAFDLDKFTL